jgi:hypothetical protein
VAVLRTKVSSVSFAQVAGLSVHILNDILYFNVPFFCIY